MYPLMPLEVVIPCECRRALITLMRLLGRPLLRLEHHAVEVAAVRTHRRGRVVRYQRHGTARVREVVHVLRLGLRLVLVVVVVVMARRRVVGESSRPRGLRWWCPC